MEYFYDVKVQQVAMWCDEESCYRREMKPTGVVLTSSPPQYEHKCEHCGKVKHLPVMYPYISYTRIYPE